MNYQPHPEMITHASEKQNFSLSGNCEVLSLDQLEEFSGGTLPPVRIRGGTGGPAVLVIGAFELGFIVGTGISTLPPVRSKLEAAGDAVGTWLGSHGIWW